MPQDTMHRVIIDTNLWIHFLLSKKLDYIDGLLASEKIKILFSNELLAELSSVVKRPRFQGLFTEIDSMRIFGIIERYAVVVPVVSAVSVCRDPKDNYLLSLAQDAAADLLLTGDKDLLVLKNFGTTSIMTISEFRTFITAPQTARR